MDNSPFNNLAGELRNRIYELVLDDHTHRSPIKLELVCNPSPRVRRKNRGTAVAGLTRSCKQIRRESMAIYLAKHEFLITGVKTSDGRTHFPKPYLDNYIEWATSLSQYTNRTSFITVDFRAMKLVATAGYNIELIERLKGFKQSFGLRPRLLVKTPRREVVNLCRWDQDPGCQTLARLGLTWEGDFNNTDGETLRRSLEQFLCARQLVAKQATSGYSVYCPPLIRTIERHVGDLQQLIATLDEDPTWTWSGSSVVV